MRRRWIFWVLVILFVWVVISRMSEIKKLAETLVGGQWQWVAIAALLQVIYYITYIGLYQSAFQVVGIESHIGELLPVTFASIFVNVAAPSGGASGVALFVDDAARRGQSAARATVGTILVLVADFSAFLVLLITGLIYLFTHHNLKIYESIAAVILVMIIAGLIGFLLLGLWRPEWLRRLLTWVKGLANRIARMIKRPDFLFVSLIGWAKQQGYATFNMGLSGLAGIGENPTDPVIERVLHYVYEHVNQFYNFKGLHEFKAKFDPTWSPRYLVYPGMTSLPAVTIAMMRADAGTDILAGRLKRPRLEKANP